MNETKTKKLSHGEALIAFAAGLAVVFAVSLQLIRNSVHQKQKTDEESTLKLKNSTNSALKKPQTVVKRGVPVGKIVKNNQINERN